MSLTTLEEPVSIGFRTDGHDVMVVGGIKGSITAWDLNSNYIIIIITQFVIVFLLLETQF